MVARFGSRAAHVPVLTGPAVARQLGHQGAAAASLDGVVLLPHERVGPHIVAHEVAHALQQTAGGADAQAAMADAPALLERMAHAPVVPEGARAETEARVGEATAQAVPAAPQSTLPPGVVSLRRTGRTPPVDVPPASAPEASNRTPAPPSAAMPAGAQAEAAHPDASAASAAPATDSAPTFALPEFVEPTLDPAAASERAAAAAAAQQALAAADSPDAVMAAYAAMPPSQQAAVQPGLGARLAETAASSNAALGEAMPEVAVRSRGGDGPPPTPAAVRVPADAPALDLGSAPAPTLAVPEAPAQPTMRVDPAYGPALERRFAESATPERVGESIEAVSTRNPGIETAVRERAEVPIDGANDPRRLEDALASQRAQASTLRQGAAQAVIDGPGPEQVAPRALEASAPAPEFPAPRLDTLQPAPEAAQLQQMALPDTVIAGFDQDSAAQMAASADAARQQMADAQGTRDTAHADAVQQAQVQRQDAETQADDSQRQAVVAQRQTIQHERQRTVDDQNAAMAGINAEAAQARDDRREQAQREVAAGQQRIDARYDQAETDAEAAVRRGEQEAERERERKRRESEQASWWDRAVDFIRSAFEALTALISGIFDAVRSAVTGLIELARQAVVGLIQAVSAALQAIVSALGEVLRGLVDRLLGEIFPELARRLNAAIDAAVNAVNRAIDTVAGALVEAVNAIAAALTSAVNAVLDAFQAAVNSALAVLQAALTGDWGALLVRVLDAVLRVLGIEPVAFHALIAQAADAVTTIVNDPGRFVTNMLDVVVGGIRRFANNFFDHFRRGIIGWLTGALGDIQIPSEWNLWTVLDLARQILGLTWDFVRERAARLIGPENVTRLEMMGSWIGTLITEGWQGLWTRVQESLASLRDSVLEAIRNFVLERVIMAAIGWLASMFNPVGALVRLVMMIWNLYQFVSAQMQRLFGIAQAVVGAISNIARGVLEPGQRAVETVLGNLVPVVIDLLMSLLGVTGVAARVRQIIQDLRQRIADAVDRMLQRVLQTLGLNRRTAAGSGAAGAGGAAAAEGPLGQAVTIDVEEGEDHTLTLERRAGQRPVAIMRSEPKPVSEWLQDLARMASAQRDDARRTAATAAVNLARAKLTELEAAAGSTPPASAQRLGQLESQLGAQIKIVFDNVVTGGRDRQLVEAVSRYGIVNFLSAIAKGQSPGGVSEIRLETLWNSRENREYVKQQFRGADPGQHEWIPTNYIMQIIARAREAREGEEDVETAALWIEVHHRWRSPTEHIIFNPTGIYQRTITLATPLVGGTNRAVVLQGHVGAIYAAADRSRETPGAVIAQTQGQGPWHEDLRRLFRENAAGTDSRAAIRAVMASIEQFAHESIWAGALTAEIERFTGYYGSGGSSPVTLSRISQTGQNAMTNILAGFTRARGVLQ